MSQELSPLTFPSLSILYYTCFEYLQQDCQTVATLREGLYVSFHSLTPFTYSIFSVITQFGCQFLLFFPPTENCRAAN